MDGLHKVSLIEGATVDNVCEGSQPTQPTSANLKWSDFTQVDTAPLAGEDALVAYRRVLTDNRRSFTSYNNPDLFIFRIDGTYQSIVRAWIDPLEFSAVFNKTASWAVAGKQDYALLEH